MGYLLVDRPEQDEDLRLRTNIFPGETHYVYTSPNEQTRQNVSVRVETYSKARR